MAIEDEPKPPNSLETLQKEIAKSASAIEAQLARTNNDSWLSCFASRLIVLMFLLEKAETKNLLGESKYNEAMLKLNRLERKHNNLINGKYRGVADIPEEEKRELLGELDILN